MSWFKKNKTDIPDKEHKEISNKEKVKKSPEEEINQYKKRLTSGESEKSAKAGLDVFKETEKSDDGVQNKDTPYNQIVNDKDIYVTVPLGKDVKKEDIDLNLTEDMVEIRVDIPEVKFHKIIEFQHNVKPKTTKATFKDGVLDIVIKRKNTEKK